MRQVMPHRSNIVSDPCDCKSFLHKKTGTYHSFGRTTDRPFQLARAQTMRLQASHSVMGASKEIKQQAKPGLNFLYGGNTAWRNSIRRQQEGTAMILRSLVACLSLSAALVPSAVYAADPASCAKPHFSDVGWTDITATTQIANQILTGLGYKPNITVLSVAVTFQSLENGDIDVFLGNWMPLQEPSQAPLVKAGKIDAVTNNLSDARIGFATSKAAYDAGLKTYADIAKFKDQLDGKLYGIEPGSGANGTISKMISDNTFGLSGFKLVESSEQAMLAETAHRIKEGKPVVFFGWQPHPMNVDLPMVYLSEGQRRVRAERWRRHGRDPDSSRIREGMS